MVVEYRCEEEAVEENEFDLNLQRLSIKDSSIRQPNAILDSWREEDRDNQAEGPSQHMVKQHYQTFGGSVLFYGSNPAEEGVLLKGKKSTPVEETKHSANTLS